MVLKKGKFVERHINTGANNKFATFLLCNGGSFRQPELLALSRLFKTKMTF